MLPTIRLHRRSTTRRLALRWRGKGVVVAWTGPLASWKRYVVHVSIAAGTAPETGWTLPSLYRWHRGFDVPALVSAKREDERRLGRMGGEP